MVDFDALYRAPQPGRALLAWALEPCRRPVCMVCGRTRFLKGRCQTCQERAYSRAHQARQAATSGKVCGTCQKPLGPQTTSGYCRAHRQTFRPATIPPAAVEPRPRQRPALRLVGTPRPIVAGDGVHCSVCGQVAPLVTAECCAACFAAISAGASPLEVRQARTQAVSA